MNRYQTVTSYNLGLIGTNLFFQICLMRSGEGKPVRRNFGTLMYESTKTQ